MTPQKCLATSYGQDWGAVEKYQGTNQGIPYIPQKEEILRHHHWFLSPFSPQFSPPPTKTYNHSDQG